MAEIAIGKYCGEGENQMLNNQELKAARKYAFYKELKTASLISIILLAIYSLLTLLIFGEILQYPISMPVFIIFSIVLFGALIIIHFLSKSKCNRIFFSTEYAPIREGREKTPLLPNGRIFAINAATIGGSLFVFFTYAIIIIIWSGITLSSFKGNIANSYNRVLTVFTKAGYLDNNIDGHNIHSQLTPSEVDYKRERTCAWLRFYKYAPNTEPIGDNYIAEVYMKFDDTGSVPVVELYYTVDENLTAEENSAKANEEFQNAELLIQKSNIQSPHPEVLTEYTLSDEFIKEFTEMYSNPLEERELCHVRDSATKYHSEAYMPFADSYFPPSIYIILGEE